MISVILLLLLCGFLRSLDLFGLGRASEYVSISIPYHFLDLFFVCITMCAGGYGTQMCVSQWECGSQSTTCRSCFSSTTCTLRIELRSVGTVTCWASQFSWFFPFNVFPLSYEAEAGYSCILAYVIQFSFPSLFKWWQEWGRETRKRRR